MGEVGGREEGEEERGGGSTAVRGMLPAWDA